MCLAGRVGAGVGLPHRPAQRIQGRVVPFVVGLRGELRQSAISERVQRAAAGPPCTMDMIIPGTDFNTLGKKVHVVPAVRG